MTIKRSEPIGVFKEYERAYFGDDKEPCDIISKKTYCICCDRFLDEVRYSVRFIDGEVINGVSESDLFFEEEL